MSDSNMTDAELISLSRPGIYTITHTASGKQYIGQAVNLTHRFSAHRHELRRNHHHSRHLQRAWDKFGAAAFTFTVLEYVEPGDGLRERLTEREQHHMDVRYAAKGSHEYNMAPVAGSMLGFRHGSTKGDATRTRVATFLNAYFAERPHLVTTASRLARVIAADVGMTPDSAAEVIADLIHARRIDASHIQTKGRIAQMRAEAVLRSFDALTASQGGNLSLPQRIHLVASEHATNATNVYRYVRARYPDLLLSSPEKGEATRQRMLEAIQDFEAQGGQPHHISQRELARTVAPAVGITPDGAEGIIARLRREGVLPHTDYVLSGLEAGHLARSAARQAAIERLFALLQNWPFDTRPSIRIANIADALDISRDSVYEYLRYLIREGRIDRHYRPCQSLQPAPISQPKLFD